MVHEQFRFAPPNGYLLGWDRQRHGDAVREAGRPDQLVNATSFDDSFCHDHRVEWTDGRRRALLTVLLSFIVDGYSMFSTESSMDRRSGRVVDQPPDGLTAALQVRVGRLPGELGFSEATAADQRLEVHGAPLELGADRPTLGKCLLHDFDG